MTGASIIQVEGTEGSLSMKNSAVEDNTLVDSGGLRGSAVQVYGTYNLGSIAHLESVAFRRNTEMKPVLHQVVESTNVSSAEVKSRCYSNTEGEVAVSHELAPGGSIKLGKSVRTLPLAEAAQLPKGSFLTLEDEILKGLQQVHFFP